MSDEFDPDETKAGTGLKGVAQAFGYALGRVFQVAAAGVAFVLLAGALLGNMGLAALLMISVFDIVLLLGALVLEFVVVRPLTGGEGDA